MSAIYFDTSALVKLLVEEDGSDLARALWDGSDAALSSRLAEPEVRAALAGAERGRLLRPPEHAAARQVWEAHWAAMRVVELSGAVSQRAGDLAHEHALRGADAVHLASAEAVAVTDLVVAVWDRRLHAAATANGFAVAPATLN